MMHRGKSRLVCLLVAVMASASIVAQSQAQERDDSRPRARDIGLVVGIFKPGEMNAITDVGNVKVGHTTVVPAMTSAQVSQRSSRRKVISTPIPSPRGFTWVMATASSLARLR